MIVTLLTDFGLTDTYVGQMKGSVLAVAPDARLVDLTHAVPPQDVFAGAFLLWAGTVHQAFPAGSVHLAVVDPGVGSARRAIAVRSMRGDAFVCPDNGLAWPAVHAQGGLAEATELTAHQYWRMPEVSSTFHGRDIFGPVAGHLAAGVPLSALGARIDDLVELELPQPHGQHGQIVHVDTYGNLVTNFSQTALPAAFSVRLGIHTIATRPHYAAVPKGTLLALVGSAGLLEISARDASAAALTGARRGTPVELLAA